MEAQIAHAALTTAKFAAGLEPVRNIPSSAPLPTVKPTETISWQSKLYRWNGTAYVATVATSDLTGFVQAAQVEANSITAAQSAAYTITGAQI